MPDYEAMILARQEEMEILADQCNGECDTCHYGIMVEDTAHRIDREPMYYCGLAGREADEWRT